jgi:hypothetical protein
MKSDLSDLEIKLALGLIVEADPIVSWTTSNSSITIQHISGKTTNLDIPFIQEYIENKFEIPWDDINSKIEEYVNNNRDTLIGIAGKDGRDGKDGLNGKDGRDGKDGKNGLNGKDGLNGKNGKNGKDGRDGKNGRSILSVNLEQDHLIVTFDDNTTEDCGPITLPGVFSQEEFNNKFDEIYNKLKKQYSGVQYVGGGGVGPVGPPGPMGPAGPPGPPGNSTAGIDPTDQVLSYTDGKLTSIKYNDNSIKTLTYDGDKLVKVGYNNGTTTTIKTLVYSDDTLIEVIVTTE